MIFGAPLKISYPLYFDGKNALVEGFICIDLVHNAGNGGFRKAREAQLLLAEIRNERFKIRIAVKSYNLACNLFIGIILVIGLPSSLPSTRTARAILTINMILASIRNTI